METPEMLFETTLAKAALFIARGDAEGLARYLANVLPKGGDLAPMRAALASFTPEFQAVALEVAPWLAADRLAPRCDPAGAILEALAKAEAAGLALSALPRLAPADRDSALAALIQTGRVIREHRTTRGRPCDVYRLAEHAAGVVPADHLDPFAFVPVPAE